MKLRDVAKILPALWKNRITLHLEGPPGCGKTDWARNQAPKIIAASTGAKEFGFKEVHLTSYEAPDVRGFLMPVTNSDGELVGKFTRPTMAPDKDAPEEGVILCDEYSQSEHDIQKATAPALLDGKMGDYQLPPGWQIMTAGNRMTDRAGVVKTLSHIENRRCVVSVEVDTKDWAVDYAQPHGIHPLLIAGAMFLPSVLTEPQPREGGPYCTLRSYTRLCKFAQDYVGAPELIGGALKEDALVMEVASGMIGASAAARMLGFLSIAGEVPTYAQVIKAPDICAKIPAGRLDVLYATTQMVLSNAKAEHANELFTFSTHLPKEFQPGMLADLIVKIGPKLVTNPLFAGWIAQPGNAALVQAARG